MPHADPLLSLDPFTLLADARRQLLEAVEALTDAHADRVAAALGTVVAHDLALAAIARAYAEGDREFEGVTPPAGLALLATVEDAHAARLALFESLSASPIREDVEVAVPWAGIETWHVHLVGLAMHEGAQAHALRDGDPLPPRMARTG